MRSETVPPEDLVAEPPGTLFRAEGEVARKRAGKHEVKRAGKRDHNQAYAEILQEIRVAQTGVQLLLGFLMTLGFTPRFASLTAGQLHVYVTALMLAISAAAMLTAPAPFHRLVTRRGLKQHLVAVSGRLALFGMITLMLAMNCALLLVLDVVLGLRGAVALTGMAMSGFLGLWFGLPIWLRIDEARKAAER